MNVEFRVSEAKMPLHLWTPEVDETSIGLQVYSIAFDLHTVNKSPLFPKTAKPRLQWMAICLRDSIIKQNPTNYYPRNMIHK